MLRGQAGAPGHRLRHRPPGDRGPPAARPGPAGDRARAVAGAGPTSPTSQQFAYDPARARALLDEAGYRDPDGDGPLPRLRLSLSCSTNEETRLQSAIIQENLRRVGIDLDVRSYEFATFYQDVLKGRFQLFSLQWVGGALVDPDILRRVYHSSQVPPAGFNRGYYSNPEVDRLLDAAAASTSDEERRELYGEVQRLVARDAAYIPIWNKTNVVVAQPVARRAARGRRPATSWVSRDMKRTRGYEPLSASSSARACGA